MSPHSWDWQPTKLGFGEGDSGGDVEILQDFLTRFGYLREHGRRGQFDADTANALRRYQVFFELSPTGRVDESTYELIRQPRCGMPDLVDEPDIPWPTRRISYSFDNFSNDLSPARTRIAVASGFNLWATVVPLTFVEVAGAGSSRLAFLIGDHGDGPFAGVVAAHAFGPRRLPDPIAGQIHFNDAEQWSDNPQGSGADLVTVAAHEMGHVLGLSHSSNPSALMHPKPGMHRYLDAEDVARIKALFGARWMMNRAEAHFPAHKGDGPLRRAFKAPMFPRRVLQAVTVLRGLHVGFDREGGDHELGQIEGRVEDTRISDRLVTFDAILGVRDWSHGWDDLYGGTLSCSVFALVSESPSVDTPVPPGLAGSAGATPES